MAAFPAIAAGYDTSPSDGRARSNLQADFERKQRDPFRLAEKSDRESVRAGIPRARSFSHISGAPEILSAALQRSSQNGRGQSNGNEHLSASTSDISLGVGWLDRYDSQ